MQVKVLGRPYLAERKTGRRIVAQRKTAAPEMDAAVPCKYLQGYGCRLATDSAIARLIENISKLLEDALGLAQVLAALASLRAGHLSQGGCHRAQSETCPKISHNFHDCLVRGHLLLGESFHDSECSARGLW